MVSAHTRSHIFSLIEDNPDPALQVSLEGKILYANAASKPLLKNWNTKQGHQVPIDWEHLLKKAYKHHKSHSQEIEINSRIFLINVIPVKHTARLNIYGRDITIAKQVDQMKSEFVSLASHQLRTPLTAVRWLTERISNQQSNELSLKQSNLISLLRDTSLRLIHLVNDLLNISRLESGRLIVEPQSTNFVELINQTIKDLEFHNQEKQHKIVVKSSKSVPSEINIDPQLMHAVLINLISNAIKYTPEHGTITINIDTQKRKLICRISDNGYGIPLEEQPKIFKQFYRASNVVTKNIDGTGLGLYLVKLIIQTSGGKIWFESKPDHGTTFSISLPLSGSKHHHGEVKLTE